MPEIDPLRAFGGGVMTVILAMSVWFGAQAATPQELENALESFNQQAYFPLPALNKEQLSRLAEGRLVKFRQYTSPEAPQRAVGIQVIPLSRARLWAAARDEDADYEGVVFWRVPEAPEGRERWYEFIDIPRPFSDRHFVIDVWDNHTLAQQTGGMAWEHPWAVAPAGLQAAERAVSSGAIDGVTPGLFRRSVEVVLNNGAWVALSLSPQETVFVFHAQSVVGGAIPDRLLADFAMMKMGKVFRGVIERATIAETWYTSGETVGGDGVPLTL
jgi:hypothetical protein